MYIENGRAYIAGGGGGFNSFVLDDLALEDAESTASESEEVLGPDRI